MECGFWDLLAWLFRWRGGGTGGPIAVRVAQCAAVVTGETAACGRSGCVDAAVAGQAGLAAACAD
ncbi:MAG: hypothetical protein JW809_19405 [Pirellulales bacterium]|nr:hypothetical protein [Pirellulales bacterium]